MPNRRTIVGRLAVTSFALWAAQAGGGVRVPLRSFKANDFGAKGDGITLDTQSIQTAIDAAAAAGGTVCFARGVYLTGAGRIENADDWEFRDSKIRGRDGRLPTIVHSVNVKGLGASAP